MKNRQANFTRDEGLALARAYRESGRKRAEFAASAGVTMATLQYWVCKMNRLEGPRVIEKAVPFVEVVPRAGGWEYGRGSAVLEMHGARLRFEGLPAPQYVAQIAASLSELIK